MKVAGKINRNKANSGMFDPNRFSVPIIVVLFKLM